MASRPDSCLQGRTVILPGGHDRVGRPLLLVTVPNGDAAPSSYDVAPALQYLLAMFRCVLDLPVICCLFTSFPYLQHDEQVQGHRRANRRTKGRLEGGEVVHSTGGGRAGGRRSGPGDRVETGRVLG